MRSAAEAVQKSFVPAIRVPVMSPPPPRKAAVTFPARAQCIDSMDSNVSTSTELWGSMLPLHGAMIPTAQN